MNLPRKMMKGIKNPGLIKAAIREWSRPLAYRLLSGYIPYPSIIYININNRCNMRCKMCDYGQGRETDFSRHLRTEEELDIEEWKSFVDDISSFRPKIAVTGTEPLMYSGLMDFVEYCKKYKLNVEITTNGYLLSNYAKKLVDLQVDKIFVSIDGPEHVHNRIRGVKDAFLKAKNGIEKVKEFRQMDKPSITINSTISNLNYHCLEDALHALTGKYDTFIFSHLNFISKEMAEAHNEIYGDICHTTTSAVSDDIDPRKVDIEFLWAQINIIKENFEGVCFNPDLNLSQLKRYYKEPLLFVNGFNRCYVPWKVSQILADGDVIVSTRCFRITFGNIKEQKFTKIWRSRALSEFRKRLRKVGAFPACTRCCGIFSPLRGF